MAVKGLTDYRREQLGNKFEHTRKPWEIDSIKVMTRLDRWYIPSHEKFDTYLWDINVRPDLVWSEVPSDHLPVILTVEPMKGERGHQRANLREDLLLQTYHQKKCRSILHDNYKIDPDSTKTRV